MKPITTFIFAFAATLCASDEKSSPQVELLLGKVEGSFKTSLKGRQFFAFEGIPYARPPVGKYRFREPQEVKPWKGVWIARTIYKCMQYNQYTPRGQDYVIGDEDCLYLNIYTPKLDKSALLDVIVYIHGGAFMFNYAGYQEPEYLLDKDVVYVSLNYRLGPLGFLSTESDLVPGNNGIRDQILALEFIQNNIKLFGGNPNSITIMGMSAGGASVHTHFLTPRSRNLFHRGISQSGTTLNPWVFMEKPLEKTKKLATIVGCATNNLKHLIECLKKRPGRQIVQAVRDFQKWLYNPFSPFGLVVDGKWSDDPVFPDHPYKLIIEGKVADLPWISSHTGSEGLYPGADFYYDEYLEEIDSRWNELLPSILDYNYTIDPNLHDSVSQKIRKHYMGDKKLSKDTYMDLIRIISDRIFVHDIRKTINLQRTVVNSPIYMYYFTYRGANSLAQLSSNVKKEFGASHGDDTCHIFKTPVDVTTNDNDKMMIELLLEMVTSFAKTGKPRLGDFDWQPVSKDPESSLNYLKISDPKNFASESLDFEQAQFWDSLPLKENEKLLDVNTKDEL